MASDAAIKKSLELRKPLLADRRRLLVWFDWHDEMLGAFIKSRLRCDTTSLEDAARFFELDHTYQPHREILLHLLAQAVFGKRKPGPQKGKASAWSPRKMILLAMLAGDLRRQNPKWSNDKIATAICETDKTFKPYRNDPRAVRKQLPKAFQELEQFDRLWKAYQLKREGKKPEMEDLKAIKAMVHERLRDPATRERIYAEMSKALSQGELEQFVR
jgi:hypothetical protein